MRPIIFFAYLGLLTLVGCVTIVSFSQSDMKVENGHRVEAHDRGLGFLNLYVPDLSSNTQLAKLCPGGLVTGLETSLRKRGFLIVQDYQLNTVASS